MPPFIYGLKRGEKDTEQGLRTIMISARGLGKRSAVSRVCLVFPTFPPLKREGRHGGLVIIPASSIWRKS